MSAPSSRTLAATDQSDATAPRTWPWVVALVIAGMLLATWPHLVNAVRTGDPGYIADGDALLYLGWSRESLNHGSWSMTDAIHRPSGPMMHAWILFVPEALLAHVLGMGVTGLGIIWRGLGGALLAVSLFLFIRRHVKSPATAAGLAAFLLFDAGLLFGQIIQRDLEVVFQLCRDPARILGGVPRILAHLRAPTPLLAIPFLVIHYACMFRARSTQSRRDVALAGITLGLLFHVYFYFATMAFPAVVLAWLIDRERRTVYVRIFVIALIVAAPAVIAGVWIKQSTPADWLHRTNKFVTVPRFDLHGLAVPRVLLAEWLITTFWVFRQQRDLIYLWLCTGVGLFLRSHQFFTGIEIENFHWSYAYGVTFSLLLTVLLVRAMHPTRVWKIIALVVLTAQIGAGFVLRSIETVASRETNHYKTLFDQWRENGITIANRSVVAGPPELLLLLAATTEIDPLSCRLVEYSSAATDLEHDERLVLNAILAGQPREPTIALGESISEATISQRRRLWERVAADLPRYITLYCVSHVIRATGEESPASFTPISSGPIWTLYGR